MLKLEQYRRVMDTRRVGHTTAMINGANSDNNIVVVVAAYNNKNYLSLPGRNKVITIDEFDSLIGCRPPILVDHYAMNIMIDETLEEFYKQREALFNIISEMNKVKQILEEIEEEIKCK